MYEAFASFERDGWERKAATYAAAWTSLTRLFAEPLLGAVAPQPGDRLLDLCCGPGVVTAAAARLGARAAGLDFSDAMLRLARAAHPALDFHLGDAAALPFGDGSFDRAVMNFGILHLSDPDRGLAEARRVLRPGGRFAFTVWAQPELNVGMTIVMEAVAAHGVQAGIVPDGPDRLRFADKGECRRSLSRAGFAAASVTFATHAVRWPVPSAEFFYEANRDGAVRIGALLAAQPPDRVAAVRRAVERALEPFRGARGFEVPMVANIVAAGVA